MGNLTHISSPTATSSNCGGAGLPSAAASGYASEDCVQGLHSSGCRDQRKKGLFFLSYLLDRVGSCPDFIL